MDINWFPGHMAKTRKQIKEDLKIVDAVIELRDARIVKSSANPDIDEICSNKPRIILLNKNDLSEIDVTNQWIESLSKDYIKVIPMNSLTGKGSNNIKKSLRCLLKGKYEMFEKKGIYNQTVRAMVVGIPNVGKSTFINNMANSKITKIGAKPGVTKNKRWIKTNMGIDLMDTPGVLWPKFEDEETGNNLAITGAIKDEIMDIEELAFRLVEKIQNNYPDNLIKRYKLDGLSEDPIENIDNIAIKRGAIISGGRIDYNRVSTIILDEFRKGKIGQISLERP